jgi:hypothetical protein
MKNKKISTFEKFERIASKFPRTINEAIQYDGSDFNDNEYDDMDIQEPETGIEPEQQHSNPESMDVEKFIDDIRKQSLQGMAQLADNPEDENYLLLKKIWQVCDRKPEQQKMAGDQQQNRNI